MADSETVKKIAIEWIEKGDKESSVFNQFISYWISFNAFYSFRTSMSGDRKALNALLADNSMSGTYKSLVIDVYKPLFENLKAVCPVTNVGRPAEQISLTNFSDFSHTINLLYLIRCNLFHGDKGETEVRDLQVIEAATPVLSLIVKALVKNHL